MPVLQYCADHTKKQVKFILMQSYVWLANGSMRNDLHCKYVATQEFKGRQPPRQFWWCFLLLAPSPSPCMPPHTGPVLLGRGAWVCVWVRGVEFELVHNSIARLRAPHDWVQWYIKLMTVRWIGNTYGYIWWILVSYHPKRTSSPFRSIVLLKFNYPQASYA